MKVNYFLQWIIIHIKYGRGEFPKLNLAHLEY